MYDTSLSECQEAGNIQGEAKTQDKYVIEGKGSSDAVRESSYSMQLSSFSGYHTVGAVTHPKSPFR